LKNLVFYKPYIYKLINFLKTNDFSILKEEQNTYFEYIFNLLVDGQVLEGISKKKLDNYLESYEAYLKGEKEKIMDDNEINEIKTHFKKINESIEKSKGYKKYIFEINNETIKVNINDELQIGRQFRNINKTYFYDINIFNKNMCEIIKESLKNDNYHNFETIFQSNLRYGMEHKPSEKFFDKYKEIITKILKSKAAENYFEKFYRAKNQELQYHFNKDSVLDNIFKRIKFCSIFRNGDQAYTSPLELRIFINCIPGEFNNSNVYSFERKILQFSRLIIISIHEILGHFLRRYYAYLTNHKVKFGTKEDKKYKTGEESDFFVEKELLGLSIFRSISLNQSLGLLKKDFNDAPILFKNQIPKKELEEIIISNSDFLEFNSENNKSDLITADDLFYYLLEGFSPQIRSSCGNRKENVIYIDNLNLFII